MIAAMLAALICVATMIIKIPLTLVNGYLNLGDDVVLLTGWLLSPAYGFFAAAIGSALADVFSGYLLYAPVTFLTKGLMAFVAFQLFKVINQRTSPLLARVTSGLAAELVMVLFYYLFEGLLYGFLPAMMNLAANGAQGLVGLVLGMVLIRLFKKHNVF